MFQDFPSNFEVGKITFGHRVKLVQIAMIGSYDHIIAIDAGIFQRVLGHHPRLVMRMANVIMARQEQFKRRMTSFLFKDVSARLAELLLQYISDYAETLPSDPEDANAPAYPIVSLTHQEIADLIGAARPVVSGIMSDWTKRGVLKKCGRLLVVHDEDRLQDLCELGSKAFEEA